MAAKKEAILTAEREPVLHRRRQQVRRFSIDGFESFAHAVIIGRSLPSKVPKVRQAAKSWNSEVRALDEHPRILASEF